MSTQLEIQQNNASLSDKDYKFILYNSSLGSLESYYSPDGWIDNELKLARHKKYHGVIKSVSTKELIFFKDAKDFIQRGYDNEGVNCELSLTIYRYNYNTMLFDLYHTGYIDFSTYSIDEVGVSVQLITKNFWTKFITRDTTEVNLRSLTSIEGLVVTPFDLNDLIVPDTSISSNAAFTELATPFITELIHIVPCTLGVTDFTETNSQILGDPINDKDSGLFREATVARIINIAGNIAGEFIGTGISFDPEVEILALVLDEDNNLINTIGLGSKSDTGVTDMSFSFDFDEDITLYPTQSILIQATISDTDKKFSYYSVDFDLSETVDGTVETEVKGFLVYEAFLKALQLILDEDNPFYSTYFGRTDTPFTTYPSDGELIALIKGIYFREFSSEPISIKVFDLFSSVFSLYGLSLSNEIIGGVEKIRVESLEYAYDSNVVLDISDRIREEDIKKSIYPDLLYSALTLGYNKYQYEQTGGLFEYNTKLKWSTVIRPIKNELQLVSKYRADYNGIKKQILTTDLTQDAKGDGDNFFLTMFRDSGDFVARMDEDYDYVGGSFYANRSLNLDISPARNLRRLKDFIRGSLLKNLNTYIRWQASETPSRLFSKRTDESYEVDEDADIRVDDLVNSIWIPELYDIEVPLTYDELQTLLDNPRGLFKLADDKYGWIMEGQTKNKDGMSTFKLLRANLDKITPIP